MIIIKYFIINVFNLGGRNIFRKISMFSLKGGNINTNIYENNLGCFQDASSSPQKNRQVCSSFNVSFFMFAFLSAPICSAGLLPRRFLHTVYISSCYCLRFSLAAPVRVGLPDL